VGGVALGGNGAPGFRLDCRDKCGGMSTTSGWTSRSYWPAKGFAALFDYAAGSNRRAAAALVVVSLIAFLP
jgi:hypothetical protein